MSSEDRDEGGALTPTTLVGDMRSASAIAQHWIDGRWRDSAEHKDSVNPATGEVIGRYALAGEDEARATTAAARRAFRETNWKSAACFGRVSCTRWRSASKHIVPI